MEMDNMELICKITDKDIGENTIGMENPRLRYASRGIVIREDGKIAVFNKSNKNEYKLPGGGKEGKETPEETFKREVLEETGYSTNVYKPDFEMSVYANPAFMNNKMHNFIVHNFFKKDSQKLDENEDVEIVLYDLDEILNPLSQFEQKLKHAYADFKNYLLNSQ